MSHRRGGKRAAEAVAASSDEDDISPKKGRYPKKDDSFRQNSQQDMTAGKVLKMSLHNIMCHEHLEVVFNKNVNFIIGKNGSGKSAILSALTIGLGARASVTERGPAIREIIRKGCDRGVIEITLSNVGPNAFKPDVYGDKIKLVRSIGSSSTYKVFNSSNKVVSTRKSVLENIIMAFNIQVDNPICILNQKASRSFLVTADDSMKYKLFMKATQLELIGENYKLAVRASHESDQSLKYTKKQLDGTLKEIASLEHKINALSSLDDLRAQCEGLTNEYEWSVVAVQENLLRSTENRAKQFEIKYKKCENENENTDDRIKEITEEIQKLSGNKEELDTDLISAKKNFNESKELSIQKTNDKNNKMDLIKKINAQIHRYNRDITSLKLEIEKIEGRSDKAEERRLLEAQIENYQTQLVEVEAMRVTKSNELNQLENNRSNISQALAAKRREIDSISSDITSKQSTISKMQKQTEDNSSVYGTNYPRLVKRIEEEWKKKRFKVKPLGPIGKYMKINDTDWTRAVEKHLGWGFLGGFCVDNANDKQVLERIMKEVFHHDHNPVIYTSNFIYHKHDVSRSCVRSSTFCSLLDAIEIENPVIANCFIDQYNPENILLIPTSKEAAAIMSKAENVPRNCRRALTQNHDQFYPDPNYRTYGGRVDRYVKFLQVSTRDAILHLNEEMTTLNATRKRYTEELNEINQNYQSIQRQYKVTEEEYTKLQKMERTLKTRMDDDKDKLSDVSHEPNVEEFKNDLKENEKKLDDLEKKKLSIEVEVKELNGEIASIDAKVKESRASINNYGQLVSGIDMQIRELKNEKEQIQRNIKNSKQRLTEIKGQWDDAKAIYDRQKAQTDSAIERAQQFCDRIDTQRSPNDIQYEKNGLENRINECERRYGPIDVLQRELNEKKEKSQEVIDQLNFIQAINEEHLERVDQRRSDYREMKRKMAEKIRNSFLSIIQLRNYNGSIAIDHGNKTLTINVNPRSKNSHSQSHVNSLSGGERSYSTVAFILALWDCSSLPFFFLDEFDVFMDNVNRRTVFEILLDHAQLHPERQYGFLTPLDASLIKISPYITVHQLAPPERGTGNQENEENH